MAAAASQPGPILPTHIGREDRARPRLREQSHSVVGLAVSGQFLMTASGQDSIDRQHSAGSSV
jgi:hypothetical protein